MKKLLVAACIILMVSVSAGWTAHWLSGTVRYRGDGGVGEGKPVTAHPQEWVDYTNAYSQYQFSFDSGTYFYKVSCGFYEGAEVYMGNTIIDAILYEDTVVDIYVQGDLDK